ncbi:MAG: ATP-dependent DNA ligase [Candidatus Pacebacteria bacterium]|nr:ATP-dependent DNA ligase [Candidatus Paceibacterota bacterium]
MFFNHFAQYLADLEKLNSRLAMTELLAQLFQELNQEEIVPASYLLQGRLMASYQSLEFQLSSKMLIRALANFYLRHEGPLEQGQLSVEQNLFEDANQDLVIDKLNKQYKDLGDLGDLFYQVLGDLPASSIAKNELSIGQVHQELIALAKVGGEGSQDKKINLLADLLGQVNALSAKYISRIILGKMRLGFSTMTMLDALSWAKTGDKSQSTILEEAFQKKADFGLLAQLYLFKENVEIKELSKLYHMELGIPVMPALCQRLNSGQEIIEKMGRVIAEPKYDGLRIQIHINKKGFPDGSLYKAYTRNLEEVSAMFPELDLVLAQCLAQTAVLDTEAIGFDPDSGKFVAFQETISRKRKYQIALKAQETPICFYAFDLLYVDGQALIEEKLLDRKKILNRVITDSPVIKKTLFQEISDAQVLTDYHHQQLALGLEGAVMKKPDSLYLAGRKGWRWVKIKEAEGQRGKLNDTLDCIMLGYYLGKGKRQNFGIGALLVGVFDQKSGKIKTLSKIGTGLTDAQFQEIKKLADQHLSKQNQANPQYDFKKELKADVWLEPSIVLEIAADEISQSPSHTAKVALRFPRLIKIRRDKNWQQATTLQELKEIKQA